MLKWLILCGLLVALLDPFLLYAIYTHAGSWTAAAVFFGPIFAGNMLAGWARSRAVASADQDPLSAMAGVMIAPFARALLWYPGPISSLLGLLLLIPITRKIATKFAMRRLMGTMMSGGGIGGASQGMMWSMNGQAGFPFGVVEPNGGAARGGAGGFSRGATSTGNLKQTDARVVDEPPDRPRLQHD